MRFQKDWILYVHSLHSTSILSRSYLHKTFTKRPKTSKLLRIVTLGTREAKYRQSGSVSDQVPGLQPGKIERAAKRSKNLRNGILIAREENLIGLFGVSVPTEGKHFLRRQGLRLSKAPE